MGTGGGQVGASNELPESEELDALYDRFLLRRQVSQVSAGGLQDLLSNAANLQALASQEGGLTGGTGAPHLQEFAAKNALTASEFAAIKCGPPCPALLYRFSNELVSTDFPMSSCACSECVPPLTVYPLHPHFEHVRLYQSAFLLLHSRPSASSLGTRALVRWRASSCTPDPLHSHWGHVRLSQSTPPIAIPTLCILAA